MPFDSGVLCIYNGFSFPGRTETIGIDSRPNWDTAGRTITYWTHSIRLRSILVADPGETTDELMTEARELLLVPGKALVFNGVGYGDLDINVGTEKDVVWGPKPQLLSYTPIGTGACEIIFQLDVAIPECPERTFERAIMELNFQMTYQLDYAGWCTRKMVGHYAIPQTRGNGRQLEDSTDNYWQLINPAIPEFFRRVSRTRTLSENKCRATFEIVDEEMGRNIFPDGVVMASGAHSIESTDKGFYMWMGTISAEYEVQQDKPIDIAWQAFWNLVGRRINLMRSAKNAPKNGVGGAPPAQAGWGQWLGEKFGQAVGFVGGGLGTLGVTKNPLLVIAGAKVGSDIGGNLGGRAGAAIAGDAHVAHNGEDPGDEAPGLFVPIRFRMTEPEIYGRPKASFELSYLVTLRLTQILQFSGLWRPTGNNWNQWVASVDRAFSPYGMLGMKFNPNDDVIIDLCLERRRPVRLQAVPNDNAGGIRQMQNVPEGDGIDPESSWLEYKNKVQIKTEDNVIEHKELPQPQSGSFEWMMRQDRQPRSTTPSNLRSGEAPSSQPSFLERYDYYRQFYKNNPPQSRLQKRTTSALEVFMTGYALRMVYDIPAPQLVSIGGLSAFLANRKDMGEGYESMIVGNFIYPMVLTKWNMRYIIPSTKAFSNNARMVTA